MIDLQFPKLADSWETPLELMVELNNLYNLLVDACSTELNSKLPCRFRDIFEINSEADLDYELEQDLVQFASDTEYAIDDIYETIHYDNVDAILEAQSERIMQNYKDEFSIFMNPPYSNVGPFMAQAWKISQWMRVVCLIPANTLTCRYMDILDMHDGKSGLRYWKNGVTVEQLSSRTKFTHPVLDSKSGPSFECCIVVLDRRKA